MTKAAKYLIYMLTIVLIIALIGVAFAWYTANTTVTATSSATAAQVENASLNFVFTESDDADPIYLSGARVLTDYYNRDKYTGEEGYSSVLGAMVDNVSELDSNNKMSLLNPKEDGATAEERVGTRDHVFTLFYLVELKGKSTVFNLKLDAVKIYKNGMSVRDVSGAEVSDAKAEYPIEITGDDGSAIANTVAKVSVKKDAVTKTYYFDVTQTTAGVFEEVVDGTLTTAVADASYDKATHTLTCAPFGTEISYVLSGHEADKDTKTAKYFACDDEEVATETEAVKNFNFTFNYYAVADGTDLTTLKVYNKAHKGNYKLYTKTGEGASAVETEYASPATSLTTGAEGADAVKVIVGITYFAPITDPATVKAVFPYSTLDYMKAHFKFTIKAGLAS